MAFVARHPRYCLLHLVLFSHRFIVKYVVMSKSYFVPDQDINSKERFFNHIQFNNTQNSAIYIKLG